MLSAIAQKIEAAFHQRRDAAKRAQASKMATEDLIQAMQAKDLTLMEDALSRQPILHKVSMECEIFMMHFRETYEVKGSLELAAELGLPLRAFEMLLEAGAQPLKPNTPILNHQQRQRPDAQLILDMVEQGFTQRQDLDRNTPIVLTKRRANRL